MLTLAGTPPSHLFRALLPRAIARRFPSAIIPIGMPCCVADILTAPLLSIGRSSPARTGSRASSRRSRTKPCRICCARRAGGGRTARGDAIISGVMEFGEENRARR